tara:strand:+ start:537 stop:791 length:255 start_codon:yes stop_codon:yes gene_type:complete
MANLNPKKFNLSSKIKLKKDEKGIFIILERKSRIIMKDGRRLLGIVKKIKEIEPNERISVLSSAPICSKTKYFLFQNGVCIQSV